MLGSRDCHNRNIMADIDPLQSKLVSLRSNILNQANHLQSELNLCLSKAVFYLTDTQVADLKRIEASIMLLINQTQQFLSDSLLQQYLTSTDLTHTLTLVRHDLRTPINAIQGYTEILLEDLENSQNSFFYSSLTKIRQWTQQILADIDHICVEATIKTHLAPIEPIESIRKTELRDNKNLEFLAFKQQFSILVVDDNEENCCVLDRYLKREGYTNTEIIHDGREALNKIYNNHYDLVLLDIIMPGVSGIDILMHLQQDIISRKIMVLMITGADTMENALTCIKLGADDLLPKPFNADMLQVRIGACVERKWSMNKEAQYLKQLEFEKQRYERLLHAIFPSSIVTELSNKGQVEARYYPNVAVLFTDVVSFTKYCDTHKPDEIIRHIQELADMCEMVALKYNIQKIKTIGDGFLATAGMLTNSSNPVLDCLRCAHELANTSRTLSSGWELRAGIHFGTVIGGIVGHRQYLFDIWGDTVNTASRVQSLSQPRAVYLSQSAWEQVHHQWPGHSLGRLAIKGKDPIEIFASDYQA